MTSTLLRLFDILDTLGDNADAVAHTLLVGGYSGLRNDGIACPIANYVMEAMPDAEVVAVALMRITVVTTDGETVVAALPPGPDAFVERFDSGAYGELAAVITGDDGEVIDDIER